MKKILKTKTASALLGFLLAFSLIASSCTLSGASSYSISTTDDDYLVKCAWSYMGKRWKYEAEIPIAIYDHFNAQERDTDYSVYAYNEMDDDWLGYTANSFTEVAEQENWEDIDTIGFVLAFVQSLPYELDNVTTGYDEYPRYPMETMVDGGETSGVDCEDTVVLLITILRQMGYDVALLLFASDEHMAAGVGISQANVDNWDRDYTLTYDETGGKLYAYCETTGPLWSLGQKDDSIESLPQIVEFV